MHEIFGSSFLHVSNLKPERCQKNVFQGFVFGQFSTFSAIPLILSILYVQFGYTYSEYALNFTQFIPSIQHPQFHST